MSTLPVRHVGRVQHGTQMHLFGLAYLYPSKVVYANFGGPITACKAVWADLVSDKKVGFQPTQEFKDKYRIYSRGLYLFNGGWTGERSGVFKTSTSRLDGLDVDNYVMTERRFHEVHPDYGTLMFKVDDSDDFYTLFYQRLMEIATAPLRLEWARTLYEMAINKAQNERVASNYQLIEEATVWGDFEVILLKPTEDGWNQLISRAVSEGKIKWDV